MKTITKDTSNGDTPSLILSIEALLALDAKGALTARIPGHARTLLESAAARLAAASQQEAREVSASLAWQDCEAALLSAHDHLGKALRIPTTPWPDPGAHGHEAAGRAIHASYCAVRFAVMDAIGALTAARCALAAAASESAMDEPRRCRREPRGNGEYVCDCKAGDCSEAHQPPPAQAEGQEAEKMRAIIRESAERQAAWAAKTPDEQYAEQQANACPHCGGSGRKDDCADEGQEAVRPAHVYTVTKNGALVEWTPTTFAFAMPDGVHALYTTPPRREWG